MELLRGATALAAAKNLLARARLAVLDLDPRARGGGAPQVLCLADAENSVVIDAIATPGLGELMAAPSPLVTYDAKPVERALLRAFGKGMRRWGCLRLTEQLLLGGRPGGVALAELAQKYEVVLPDATAGLAGFAAHARALYALVQAQIERVRASELVWPSRIEAAAVAPIAAMEHHGMPLDAARWRELDAASIREREALREELLAWFCAHGDPGLLGLSTLDLDSDAELRRALGAAGFAVPDARRATLLSLPDPLGKKLGRYRELAKLVNAYGESFLAHLTEDGRVHATFEQIGASTGRLSCHDPNLQAVVKDSERRKCFAAREGRRLVVADYATCELRILAEMSGDPVFAEAFERNEDLHARVASRVFGKPVSKHENPELRERAKAISFGLVYGMGAPGLARTVGVDLPRAEALLQRYFESFPKIGGFLAHTAEEALARGFARTLTGRRLYLDPGADRRAAERVAKNMPIQGTSADITKLALARVHTALDEFAEAFIVNTVHDELVVECRAQDTEQVAALTERQMREAAAEVLRRIPVVVDTAVGRYWCK